MSMKTSGTAMRQMEDNPVGTLLREKVENFKAVVPVVRL